MPFYHVLRRLVAGPNPKGTKIGTYARLDFDTKLLLALADPRDGFEYQLMPIRIAFDGDFSCPTNWLEFGEAGAAQRLVMGRPTGRDHLRWYKLCVLAPLISLRITGDQCVY